uniref:3-oxoacyl-acyl-carrier-protein reductase n=1 Tax=Lepeophtheirus salmonis TaxID=72036 RepID=D3PIZ2_LEPSM|nr:3-oxoacyl-acyl-carrier-protein reductase [Lepeophtheirus salmonis]
MLLLSQVLKRGVSQFQMSGLGKKIVLITGASGGIGEGTALHFASLGSKLSLVARRKEELERVSEACKAKGAQDVIYTVQDLSSGEACSACVDETFNYYGGLDVVVNNAGVMYGQKLQEVTPEIFDHSMNLNIHSALRITQSATKYLEKSKKQPAIVNVSSIAGLRAFPGVLAYKISKAGLDQMTRCTALELISKGIRVNSVNPGVIETDLFKNAGMSDKSSKSYLDRAKKTHPIGRPGRADEVAKVIAFLASDDASLIVGQTISVDGGRSVVCPY